MVSRELSPDRVNSFRIFILGMHIPGETPVIQHGPVNGDIQRVSCFYPENLVYKP